MGTIDFQQPIVSTTKKNMKLFLIAAVLVASVFAEPESEAKADAKPWLAYSNLGYAGWPYAAGYAAYAYPSVYNTAYAAPVATYAGAHLIGKREAEADSEAKPWLTYANYGYAGYPYAATYAAGAYAYPSVYSAAYARPVATYAGAHLIGKREAEADSWYGYSGYASPYTTYGGVDYRPYTYGRVYGAYGYGW